MKKALLAALLLLALLAQGAAAMEGEYFECIWLEWDQFDPIVEEEQSPIMKGRVLASDVIERVEATLYDLRLMEVERTWVWTAEAGPVRELSLDEMRRALFRGARPGEKRLAITAEGGGRSFVVCDREMYKCGYLGRPGNITDKCAFDVSGRRVWLRNDEDTRYFWKPKGADDVLTVTLPEGAAAEGVQVQWDAMPDAVLLRCYDGQGALLLETRATQSDFLPIISWYDIPAAARSFSISVSGGVAGQLLVFEQGKTPAMAQKWRKTAEKWDMMIVSTHQDDEILFFGGAIPWYTAQGREVGVVYMTNCGFDRYKEALRGLWTAGLSNYPSFIGLTDGRRQSRQHAFSDWGGEDYVIGLLVERIRRYRPEVVLTHDFEGEYGHMQHVATAYAVARAVEAAADPQSYPQSAALYGAWQAKKLYIHLWGQNRIALDWTREVPGFGGMTGIQIARRAYDMHRSQHAIVRFDLSYRYPSDRFGLYYTAVGPDLRGDDFFEHID